MSNKSANSDLGTIFSIVGILLLVCSLAMLLVYVAVLTSDIPTPQIHFGFYLSALTLLLMGCCLSFTSSYGFQHDRHWAKPIALCQVVSVLLLGLLVVAHSVFYGILILIFVSGIAVRVLKANPAEGI